MSDDDMIRRGDALNAIMTTDFRHEAHEAIAALPAAAPVDALEIWKLANSRDHDDPVFLAALRAIGGPRNG